MTHQHQRRPFWPHNWRDAMYAAATLLLVTLWVVVVAIGVKAGGLH